MKVEVTLECANHSVSSRSFAFRPERYHQLSLDGSQVLPRGAGRSYGDASLNTEKSVILMERLNRFLAFDSKNGVVRVEAGVKVRDILDTFVPRGWFLPVVPSTKEATIGGCVACDIYGKNHTKLGSLGQHIREIELLTADGNHRRCSPVEFPELFWATVGGLGLTGVITEVALQLVPVGSAYLSTHSYFAPNLEALLDLFVESTYGDTYMSAWVDLSAKAKDLGRGWLKTAHHASLEELNGIAKGPFSQRLSHQFKIPFCSPRWFLNPWTTKGINNLIHTYKRCKTTSSIIDYDNYFFSEDKLSKRYRFYGRKGFVAYEAAIPIDNAVKGIKELIHALHLSHYSSFSSSLQRIGSEGLALLTFPYEGYVIKLKLPVLDDKIYSFLDTLDEIVLSFGGRINISSDSRAKPHCIKKMYPRLNQWRKVKAMIDPTYLFSSDLYRRLQWE